MQSSAASKEAQVKWEAANNVQAVTDDLYKTDMQQQRDLRDNKRPWKDDPHYFTHVKISAIAVLKMLIHARDGLSEIPGKDRDVEVMGLLLGKLEEHTIVVTDVFGVLKGNEVRVQAGVEDYEYMVQYTTAIEKIGKLEGVVGWYHSHPGFGCWLSGIDVGTQSSNQTHIDPAYLGIVVDPKRTLSSGRVEIGAFRTWPENFNVPQHLKMKPPKGKGDFDFGVHAEKYYQLQHSIFKSGLDSFLLEKLWTKYWVQTLAVSRNLFNRDFDAEQLDNLNDLLVDTERNLDKHKGTGKKKDESELSVVAKDCSKNAQEQIHAVINQVVKHSLFNMETKAS